MIPSPYLRYVQVGEGLYYSKGLRPFVHSPLGLEFCLSGYEGYI